jgi:hypothetical protein
MLQNFLQPWFPNFRNNLVLVRGKPFQPSLMIEGKARAYLRLGWTPDPEAGKAFHGPLLAYHKNAGTTAVKSVITLAPNNEAGCRFKKSKCHCIKMFCICVWPFVCKLQRKCSVMNTAPGSCILKHYRFVMYIKWTS